MDELYGTIRDRLLAEFPGVEVDDKHQHYDGYRLPGSEEYFCRIEVRKEKIWIEYSGERAGLELKRSDFVSTTNWSIIMDEADFEKALAILKWLHCNGKKPAGMM